MAKALVAMSGGVDSALAAKRTLDAGYETIGCMMKLHTEAATCGSADEAASAQAVADRLGIPFYVVDYTADFAQAVMARFIDEYACGRTPNPCIFCNKEMKFDRLYREAQEQGCDTIVTGHYARVEYDKTRGKWLLKKAKSLAKDQTYVLYFLTQEQLAHTRFPLGEIESKEEVRRQAAQSGFANAQKRDSQDICFVPDGKYADFICRCTGKEYPVGDFVDADGRVLGQHNGLIRYTIGQRKGLGLSLPAPLYVLRKDRENNTVVLAPEEALYSRRLWAEEFSFVSGDVPTAPLRAWARTRYSAKEAPATVTVCADGRLEIVFDEPQRAVTMGQAVVLYDGDEVLGGGTIAAVEEGV